MCGVCFSDGCSALGPLFGCVDPTASVCDQPRAHPPPCHPHQTISKGGSSACALRCHAWWSACYCCCSLSCCWLLSGLQSTTATAAMEVGAIGTAEPTQSGERFQPADQGVWGVRTGGKTEIAQVHSIYKTGIIGAIWHVCSHAPLASLGASLRVLRRFALDNSLTYAPVPALHFALPAPKHGFESPRLVSWPAIVNCAG